MEYFKTIFDLKKFLKLHKKDGVTIGFVPTMGSLHSGHVSLIKKSKKENTITIVSIYVNPCQFDNKNDFIYYPRNIDGDLKRLLDLGCEAVFCPTVKEMESCKIPESNIRLGSLNLILEAKKRPGHFQGVIKIVTKLFKITSPNNAYFGEKDFQQLFIIKKLCEQLFNNINVISCKTIREKSGLAKSSRNKKLNSNELVIAQSIYKLLCMVKKHISKWGVKKCKNYVDSQCDENRKIKLDYFEIVEQDSFSFAKKISNEHNYRAMIAVKIGTTRLIDNLKL